jgi:hypothetical protein
MDSALPRGGQDARLTPKGDAVAFVRRTLVKERPHVQGKCTATFWSQEGFRAG